jgi:nitroreductase
MQKNNTMNDKYQERYSKHQQRKQESLTSTFGKKHFKKYTNKEQKTFFQILNNRCSQRVFNDEEITTPELKAILDALETAPSSCNRKAVEYRIITNRQDKEILSGLLVGGVGWVYRGQVILLLLAQMEAYKNPAERDSMPYLDAGTVIQTAYLSAAALNIGCCFVNPNIREKNEEFFRERFNIGDEELFCGAIVLGHFSRKHSRDCYAKSNRGKEHPNWKGGYDKKGYSSEWKRTIRRTARERDNYICYDLR